MLSCGERIRRNQYEQETRMLDPEHIDVADLSFRELHAPDQGSRRRGGDRGQQREDHYDVGRHR